jgi:Pycsar effector protein
MDQTENCIRFARHNFENLQSLIRFADAKAGALAGYVFVLVGTGGNLFIKALDRFHLSGSFWRGVLDTIFCIGWTAFLAIAAVVVLRRLLGVVLPRSAEHYDKVDHSRNIMYWEHIALRANNEAYAQDVARCDNATELRNLSDQVYELAKIVGAKMKAVDSVRSPVIWMTLSWVVGISTAALVILVG